MLSSKAMAQWAYPKRKRSIGDARLDALAIVRGGATECVKPRASIAAEVRIPLDL